MWGNRSSSIPALDNLPPQRRYGGRVTATDELAIHSGGDLYTVDGSGQVTRLPSWPRGASIQLEFSGAPTFVHSARLIMQGGASRTFSAGEAADLISNGSGIWRCYPRRPAASDISDAGAAGRSVLAAADAPTARSVLYAAPFDALAFNGMQVNGGVDVSQELGTTGATLATGTAKYTADMWEAQYVHGAATAVLTSAQLGAASFPGTAPGGYSFGLQLKATTALSSPANADYALVRHQIEGYRIARMAWGTANAQPLAYCLQFYSTVSGVAFIKFSNSAKNRCYYKELTVAAGWNYFNGTIAGDTSGTWQATTSAGLIIEIFSAGKAASPATPGAWGSTSTTQTTNSSNLLGTNNNLTIVTGLIVLPGLELPASDRAALIMRPFVSELRDCKRNFYNGLPPLVGLCSSSTSIARATALHPVPMRIAPTSTITSATTFYTGPTSSTTTKTGENSTADILQMDIGGLSGLTAGSMAILLQGSGGNINVDGRF